MNRKIRSLTSYRALAAALVLFCHIIPFASLRGPFFVLKYGWAGVSLFFALSGFLFTYLYLDVFTESFRSLGAFFYKRLFRIFPLYFALLALTVVTTGRYGPMDILTHATMTHGFFARYRFSINPPAWTLSVEEAFYALVPVLMLTLGRFPRWTRMRAEWLRLMLQLAVLFVMTHAFGEICRGVVYLKELHSGWIDVDLWTATIFGRFSDFAFGMAAGVFVIRFPQSPVLRNRFLSTLCFVLGGAVFLAAARWMEVHGGVTGAEKDPHFTLAAQAYGLAGALLILGLCGNTIIKAVFDNPVAEYLGKISFALYLCQFLEVGPIPRIATSLMENARTLLGNDWAAAFVTYVGVSLVAAVLHHGIEKPAHAWLTARFAGEPQRSLLAGKSTSEEISPLGVDLSG